jgi:hypothetical protein
MCKKVKKMKKKAIFFTILMLASLFVAPILAKQEETGNGAQSGKHYNLNLLGKNWNSDKDEAETLINSIIKSDNGHRIFVKLSGKTRILLQEQDDFGVIDADGTDGKAIFGLPDPGPVADEETGEYYPEEAEYKIFVRILGPPRGDATMVTGAYTDLAGNQWIVSQETITLGQSSGKVKRDSPPKFVDCTKELTTVLYDYDADGTVERVPIFSDKYEGYFWDLDNNGLRHVQLRFYPVEEAPA